MFFIRCMYIATGLRVGIKSHKKALLLGVIMLWKYFEQTI